MKQLDLFAGIGGISLAAEWAGIETVAFCEKEPFAQNILRRRFPGRPIYNDVFHLTKEVLDRDGITNIDIVAGGFPCQPFSHAGKRGGTADDRYIWPEMCRIIGDVRPSWVFAENVDGLVSMAQSGGDIILEDEATICEEAEMVIETIRKDLEAIGYRSIPVVIPACGVGASHRRYRIFILAYSESGGQQQTRKDGERSEKWASSSSVMGDAKCCRRNGDDGRRANSQPPIRCEGDPLVYACSTGRKECYTSAIPNESGYNSRCSDAGGASGTTQPGLGGGPYELSDWMDGWGMNPIDSLFNFISSYPQPALKGQTQHDWEPPRVTTGVKTRAARIKALGNAVDPLQALPVLYGIRVIHEFLMKGGRFP